MIETQVEAEVDEEVIESVMKLDVAGEEPGGVASTSTAVVEEPEFVSYNGPL